MISRKIYNWLDKDTTKVRHREFPLYEYTITHVDDDQTTVVARDYILDEGFAKFWMYKKSISKHRHSDAILLVGDAFFPKRQTVKELGSIKEIERKKAGYQYFTVKHDIFNGEIEEVDMEIEKL